jgi:hypothetical protein
MPKPKETTMLDVYNHEGEFSHILDGEEFEFKGATLFVNATASVVYGRQGGEFLWEIDSVVISYATDIDGEDVRMTADEEKELAALIAFEYSNNMDIEEKAYGEHEEVLYWESRR